MSDENGMGFQAAFVDDLRLTLRVPYPLIVLRGEEEAALSGLLRELSVSLGLEVHFWSATAGLWAAGEIRPRALRGRSSVELFLDALEVLPHHEEGRLFVFFEPGEALQDAQARRSLKEAIPGLVAQRHVIVLLGSALSIPQGLARVATFLKAPFPDRSILGHHLERVLPSARHRLLPRERMVGAALGLTRGEARRAFERVRITHEEAGRPMSFDWTQAVLREKKRVVAQHDVVTFVDATIGLDSVGGLDDLKSWLEVRKAAFSQEARAFKLPVPRGLLLIGVQGCGKSLVSKAIAQYWELPLLRLELGQVFAGHDAPDAAVQRALHTAESLAPSVLWVDEIEKGFGPKAESAAARILGTLLTWLQEKQSEVFFVATANEVEELPPELLRRGRFDEMFFVDLPDLDARSQILAIHLRRRSRDPQNFNLTRLAKETEHFSGAELEQVVVDGLYEAFVEGRELQTDDMSQAVETTVPLYVTRSDDIKRLRDWASSRARFAAHDRKMLAFFDTP